MRSLFGSFVAPAILVSVAISSAGSVTADTASASPTVADIFARHEAAVGYSLADGTKPMEYR